MSHRINPSSTWLRQLNRRQLKKLRLGEFKELALEIKLAFAQPLEDAQLDVLLNTFIDFVEHRKLTMTGFGGVLPLSETEVFVCRDGLGSVTEEDVRELLDWLNARAEISNATAGERIDAWYGF